jgi:NarL family two-component system sensor histidine kinase LiaS
MARHDELISLVVQDDGVGITQNPVVGRNFGLSGMTERVAMLGGTAKVVSGKNKGTRIEVKVPVTHRAPDERGHNKEGDERPFFMRRAAAVGRDVH